MTTLPSSEGTETRSRSVAVIAAHPDDEVLGCGGTLARHVDQGDRVHVLILAEGLTSRDPTRQRERDIAAISRLQEAARAAHEILGSASLEFLDFPDNRMDSLERLDVIKSVEAFLDRHSPGIVYTHSSLDLNVDHGVVHEAVVTACRPIPGILQRTLLAFEVPSSTEWHFSEGNGSFHPNWFVDVSATLDRKLAALRCYAEEMRPFPHARSVDAVYHLARWRGSSVGFDAAEAFALLRHLSPEGNAP